MELIKKFEKYMELLISKEKMEQELNMLNDAIDNARYEMYCIGNGNYSPRIGIIIGLIIGIIIAINNGIGMGFMTTLLLSIGIELFISASYDLKEDDRIEAAKEYYDKNIVPIQDGINDIEKDITILVQSDDWFSMKQEIPSEFINVEAFEYFIKVLRNGQAETIKEVYNMYTNKLQHDQLVSLNSKQISLNKQILETQEAQLSSSRSIESGLGDIMSNQQKMSKQLKYNNVVSTLDYLNSRKTRKAVNEMNKREEKLLGGR